MMQDKLGHLALNNGLCHSVSIVIFSHNTVILNELTVMVAQYCSFIVAQASFNLYLLVAFIVRYTLVSC